MKFRAVTVKQWLDEEARPDEPQLADELLTGWIVLQGKIPRFSRRMTESEAKIIEFAFTTLQNKKLLVAVEQLDFDYIPNSIGCDAYTGPTDGVADD